MKLSLFLICICLPVLLCGQSICEIAKSPKRYYSLLEKDKSGHLFKNGQDTCVLKVLDSLKSYVITNNDTAALGILNTISGQSDGYVAEAMDGIAANIFYRKTPLLLWFCDMNKNSKLETNLILALSMEVSVDKKTAKKRIDRFVAKTKKESLTSSQLTLLDSIVKRIDPGIWN